MGGSDYLLAGLVAVWAGLDRTAAFQLMVCRPVVAGPLTGLVLGEPAAGLQVGVLVELLWLGRLPVGAAVPPDDTQVAVGGTVLTLFLQQTAGLPLLPAALLATLTALPMGKVGQLFERAVRQSNSRLLPAAEAALAAGDLEGVGRWHLKGLAAFGLAALGSYGFVVGAGSLLLPLVVDLLREPVIAGQHWLRLVLPLAGTGVILGAINVSRRLTLFGASFVASLLLLWMR